MIRVVSRAIVFAVAAQAMGSMAAQAISANAQIVQALISSRFDSCTQANTQQSIPVGPLPASATLPGFSWNLASSGLSMTASGTATICNFFSPPGTFARNGTVDVTLTSPYETSCAIQVVGSYAATGGTATTVVSGSVQATLGGFFSPITSVNQTDVVRVGPAGTTITIAHRCNVSAAFTGFASVQTNLTVSWAPVDSASTAVFGVGCLTGATVQTATSVPHLGSNMNGTVSGVAVPLGIVAIGFSDLTSSAGALPFSLTQIGMTDCSLLQSADVVQPAAPGSPTTLDFQVPLPGAASLVGVNLFTQAFSFAPGVNPLGVTASNGVRWQLGT